MKALLFFLAFSILPICLYSQLRYEVRGTVVDTAGHGISGATVKLESTKDTLLSKTSDDGTYLLSGIASLDFILTISNLGFQTVEKRLFLHNDRFLVVLAPILLKPQAYELDQISILGKRAVIVKKDTIEYQARNYKLRENAMMEDLVRKLPGLIFNRNGELLAQGKLVTRVTLNGKDFFGGDLETALKNIPASLIERIQVIDDYRDMGLAGGAETGSYSRIINIKTWADIREGYFINGNAGTGNQGRYQFSGMANYFDNSRELAAYGNFNNNNSHLAGSDFATSAPGNGLNASTGAGINYRERYSKNMTFYGNYVFSKNVNNLLSETFRTNTFADNSIVRNRDTTDSKSTVYSHSVQMNLEYSDSSNFIQLSPSFNYNQRLNISDAFLYQSRSRFGHVLDSLHQKTIDRSHSDLPSMALRVIGSHRFNSDGRSIFAELEVRNGTNHSDQAIDAFMSFFGQPNASRIDSVQRQILKTENNNLNTSVRLVYVEPLTRLSRLEVGYAFRYSHYSNDRQTRIDWVKRIDSLSNQYEYSFITNTFKLAFKHLGRKHSYTFGISVQPTLLSGRSIGDFSGLSKTALNLIPEMNYNFLISTEKSLTVSYSAVSNPPSYIQLQPVTDLTNPQYPVTGNPDLKSDLAHTLEIAYNSFSPTSGASLFANITGGYIHNQVVANSILRTDNNSLIAQETRFANVNGNYTIGASYNLSLPNQNRSFVLDLNGSGSYNNIVSLNDSQRLLNRNIVLSQALKLEFNPSEKMDIVPSVVYTYNRNKYSIDRFDFSELSTWAIGGGGRIGLLKNFSVGFQADKNFNIGFTGTGRANPFIINTYLESRLLKNRRGTLRFTAFDLLDQNTSVQRTILNNAVLDNRSNRLGRYFMLLFTINLSKFDTAA